MVNKKYTQEEVKYFLTESNNIEGVYDEDSYKQALYAWKYLSKEKEMHIDLILKTHKILMLHQKLMPYERGYFRNVAVYIGNRQGLNAVKIRDAMKHLIMNINDLVQNGKNQDEGFLEGVIKRHHIEYEKIHPFVDGNGRTGRMFLNWERLQLGLPILIIKESERQAYYKWFK